MKYIVNNLTLALGSGTEDIREATAAKLGIKAREIKSLRIVKESVDARRKPKIRVVYSILAETDAKVDTARSDIKPSETEQSNEPVPGNRPLGKRPLVIGSGPAGLFAALVLAQNGYMPVVLERGEKLEKRSQKVKHYWDTGALDTETNVQFGEGGAGTFSDGKLTTRISDSRCEKVLSEFHISGAPEDILFKSKPHIGTDNLKRVVVNMRGRIEELGGEFRFLSRVTSLIIRDGRVRGAVVNESESIEADVVVLAIGHSARDTYSSLLTNGIGFVQKPFSIGVRIEHPQVLIDRSQYGDAAGHPSLGPADYQLFLKSGERTAYSFCMCPGGIVVASASEKDSIVTNGMSEFARDRENANSALVVSVEPGDFGSAHPLAGVEFQRKWEQLAFRTGGSDNSAPVQRLEDFVAGRQSSDLGTVKPSYTGKTKLSDLNLCLPEYVTQTMKNSIGYFDRKIKGFGMGDAVMTGVETRTSSPVRIPRGDTLEAEGIGGLYPAGEGAGYAGGIVSAAVDGIRIAEQIISTYKRPLAD